MRKLLRPGANCDGDTPEGAANCKQNAPSSEPSLCSNEMATTHPPPELLKYIGVREPEVGHPPALIPRAMKCSSTTPLAPSKPSWQSNRQTAETPVISVLVNCAYEINITCAADLGRCGAFT